jgi:hypothetical protein
MVTTNVKTSFSKCTEVATNSRCHGGSFVDANNKAHWCPQFKLYRKFRDRCDRCECEPKQLTASSCITCTAADLWTTNATLVRCASGACWCSSVVSGHWSRVTTQFMNNTCTRYDVCSLSDIRGVRLGAGRFMQ